MNQCLLATTASLLITGLIATTPVSAADVPEISSDGLELVEKTRRGELYVDQGVDWSVYDSIHLDQASVAFRKNWKRDQNRYQFNKVRDEDMERIKTELAAMFDEVFKQELTDEGGYQMVDSSGESVMRIAPHIVDLDVYAPDTRTAVRTESYTEQAGRMTLKLEIYDSVTGDLIATASNRQESPRRGYMQWTTSVTNRAEAKRMLQRWAKQLNEVLEEIRQNAPSAAAS